MANYKATGGCLCGGVKYEFTKPFAHVFCCHCSMCRKVIGADFGTFGAVHVDHFKMLKNDTLRHYQSSENITRSFCGNCGCNIHDKLKNDEIKYLFLTMGSVDGDPGAAIEFHIFASSKAPWVKILDGKPTCDGMELINLEDLKK